ncbi:hypothetical protein ElP_66340 [Tautonia plasticadhaerens]|uniref:Uncharacterized protein n=1 Tax=Tautonia plasticadhaerens TaxID=2527974 RepID=A0A518HCU0_9BACT|nr:hypothetical protein ElP_66340 [Tautonia plasticadhaerens]
MDVKWPCERVSEGSGHATIIPDRMVHPGRSLTRAVVPDPLPRLRGRGWPEAG